MPRYFEGRFAWRNPQGKVLTFANEHEWERMVMRCAHADVKLSADGFLYCARCGCLPNLKGARHGFA